jgi:hypothetical protein
MKNKDPHLLSNLPAYGEDGSVYAVVESPKGPLVKLKFEIKLGVFTVAHSLPLGMTQISGKGLPSAPPCCTQSLR